MFDESTALRLDRLEREARRRKWGSAVLTASQRGHHEQARNPAQVAAAGDLPLMDLLDERLDRLERKHQRLEWQISRLEARIAFWRRASAAALLSAVVVSVGLAAFAGRPRVAALLSGGLPVVSRSSLDAPK